jgi:hypothetical protein
MNHVARGLIVLLSLFAAGICGASLETALFDESPQFAVESDATHNGGERLGITQPHYTFDTLADSDTDYPDLSECNPGNLVVESVINDTPQYAAEPEGSLLMHPKVQLFNGQEEFLSEQCVCQCKMRGARRLLRHRLR